MSFPTFFSLYTKAGYSFFLFVSAARNLWNDPQHGGPPNPLQWDAPPSAATYAGTAAAPPPLSEAARIVVGFGLKKQWRSRHSPTLRSSVGRGIRMAPGLST